MIKISKKSTLNKKCYICGTTRNIHRHHVFHGSANRKQSEKYGMVVCLCGYHHNQSSQGVHFNTSLDRILKMQYQRQFEDEYGHEEFMKIFGRNYL